MTRKASETGRCPECSGTMPSCAPLAVPYVPFQQENASIYKDCDALSQGTLFPCLNLPFHLAVNGTPVPMTPLAQLQALDFVLQELALYLDTHKDDEEAFELFQQYTALMERSRASYERQNGPLNLTAAAADSSWQWTHSPWPWDLKGED